MRSELTAQQTPGEVGRGCDGASPGRLEFRTRALTFEPRRVLSRRNGLRFLALCLFLVTCRSPASPSLSPDLVVAGGESGRLVYVDANVGNLSGTASFTLGTILASAFDVSKRTAYITALTSSSRELLAVDLNTGTIRSRIPMADAAHPVYFTGVQLSGDPIAFLPNGNILAIGNAVRGDTVGIASFDPTTRAVGGFRGPLNALGFAVIPTTGSLGAFVNTGRRNDGRASVSLLLLAPGSLQTLDSIAPAPPLEDPIQLVAAPDGDRLYIGNYTHIYSYSLQQRSVVASAVREAMGHIAVSPDGQLVALSDEGSWPDDAGSGKLFLHSANLGLLKIIDLSAASRDGNPVVTHQMAFSHDGRWLFVAAGTASRGTLYPPQRAQVLVINARTLEFAKAVELNDWGGSVLFPLR